MPDGKDWLYRPIARGWMDLSGLKSGLFDLVDWADANDAISVFDENTRRASEAR